MQSRMFQSTQEEIAESRPTEKDLREAWGDFCLQLAQRYPGDKYLATLTYGGEEAPTLSKSIRSANDFERWCLSLGVHGVGVIEQGLLHGRFHHHMLLIGEQRAIDQARSMWELKNGFVAISKARSVETCARYCAKYLVKDGTSDWRFF